jgi:hypothetical protein
MSHPVGTYHFLAWGRRGIIGSLNAPDAGGSLPTRATMQVNVSVTSQGATPATVPVPPVTVQLYGPGDIQSIESVHVVRTDPKPLTPNFEPNYLAGIEFDAPDYPWLFTPASPAGDRIRPWLVLIVLKGNEFKPGPDAPHGVSTIDVLDISALQPLDDSWNWAHVQVSGDDTLAGKMQTEPSAVISRILCARRLDPETPYTAFLVPAFENGRQVGLGLDVSGLTKSDPAWNTTTPAPWQLPIYYTFTFNTSDQGDFESLVRRLVPRKLGNDIGQRPMLVNDPEPAFPSAGPPLGLDGALQSLAVVETPWNDPDKTAFQTELQDFINLTTPVVDDPAHPNPEPVVVPPIYGRWHVGVGSVDRTQTRWLDQLNLDPRNRTEGGMGTQVVQAGRTSLMASAWKQIAGIEQANALLRGAQLARATMQTMHLAQFSAATNATLLSLTAPIHAKTLASPQTIRAIILRSRVPVRMLSGAFRRVTSRLGPIRKRQAMLSGTTAPLAAGSLLEKVNDNTISIVPPAKPPAGLVPIEDISDSLEPTWFKNLPGWLRSAFLPIAIIVLLLLAIVLWFILGPIVAVAFVVVATIVAYTQRAKIEALLQGAQTAATLQIAALTPQAIATVPPRPAFAVVDAGQPAASSTSSSATADSAEAQAFRQALEGMTAELQTTEPDPPLAAALELSTLRDTLIASIDPVTTVPKRLLSMIAIQARLDWRPPDPIQPIMAAPDFPQPMYVPLRDLDPQYILPGVDQIPPDTVGLLETNHAFIEAFMVGLNHEMSRQLLWAGYPTDLRGSYFRQFWDVSKYVPVPSDPTDPAQLREKLKDIPPIHTWPLSGPLGTHENRTDIVPNNVVLIIRGELLRRYPNTIIYAAKAKVVDGQRMIDDTDERYPIFGGTLPTDITFIGFNLSPEDAKGGTMASPDGFFFVFQQHPTEPRFGLEPSSTGVVQHWADLAWTNFGSDKKVTPAATPLAAQKYVGEWAPWRLASTVFAAALQQNTVPAFLSASNPPIGANIVADTDDPNDPANQWGVDAAQTAYITLRMPFRISIHADLMVPS